MKPLFDTYLFVDWSAAAGPTAVEPTKDAVWIGELVADAASPSSTYHRTRRQGVAWVRERLARHVEKGRRALVGFDFPNGYPRGTARALGLSGDKPPWRAVWELLAERMEDDERNRNNRFRVAAELNRRIGDAVPGPFWGCPKGARGPTLTSTRKEFFDFPYPTPKGALRNRRLAERRLPGTQEVWKLLGIGSVGSQVLTGVPYLHALRFDPELGAHGRVWPFETGFEAPGEGGPGILYAEVWPGIVEERVRARGQEAVRDRIQMEELCLWAREEDGAGRLADLLRRPGGLADGQVEDCVAEEGWILGALDAVPVAPPRTS